MVRYVAHQMRSRLPQCVEMEDLFSAGLVGLVDAAQKFSPSKNVQFASYAQFRVRGAIQDSLRAIDWAPRELRRKGRDVHSAQETLTARLGHTPTEEEVASELRIPLQTYQKLRTALHQSEIGSLQPPMRESDERDEQIEVPAQAKDDPLSQCMENELRERLLKNINALPELEQRVMTLHFYDEMSMREVGEFLGISQGRLAAIQRSAVKKLHVSLNDISAHGSQRIKGMPSRENPSSSGIQKHSVPSNMAA
jgi:RNA polymerase sigma factor for flagellar operon FliA